MTEMSGRWYKKSTEGLRRIIADEENIKELWDETQETSRKSLKTNLGPCICKDVSLMKAILSVPLIISLIKKNTSYCILITFHILLFNKLFL